MEEKRRVAVLGVTGFIGRGLPQLLAARGYVCTGISRSGSGNLPGVASWQKPDSMDLGGYHAVINLAGERIDRRWTSANRRRFHESRVGLTRQLVEALARCQKTPRAQSVRGIALELERLANHVGDLGALANDIGFLPTASYCGRIRGDFLNMTAALCGSRFGRGMIRPGGVGFGVDETIVGELLKRLEEAERDTTGAVELLWDTPSVMARLEDTGPVPKGVAQQLGLVGPAARACGMRRDARNDHPSGIFRFAHIPVSTWDTGDVFARAYVRWLEVQRSIDFVREQLRALPPGEARSRVGTLAPDELAVALVEGWRGELCHVALTDGTGRFERYKVVDPSFHNWTGLAYALRGQQISDFPLCNKSFNLSYCGHDL